MLHRFFNIFQAVDIEEGFLLAGKRSIGQIFGSGRRAHGHGDIFAARIGHHFIPCGFNVGIELLGERGV